MRPRNNTHGARSRALLLLARWRGSSGWPEHRALRRSGPRRDARWRATSDQRTYGLVAVFPMSGITWLVSLQGPPGPGTSRKKVHGAVPRAVYALSTRVAQENVVPRSIPGDWIFADLRTEHFRPHFHRPHVTSSLIHRAYLFLLAPKRRMQVASPPGVPDVLGVNHVIPPLESEQSPKQGLGEFWVSQPAPRTYSASPARHLGTRIGPARLSGRPVRLQIWFQRTVSHLSRLSANGPRVTCHGS